jgi:hypothetical protein
MKPHATNKAYSVVAAIMSLFQFLRRRRRATDMRRYLHENLSST